MLTKNMCHESKCWPMYCLGKPKITLKTGTKMMIELNRKYSVGKPLVNLCPVAC